MHPLAAALVWLCEPLRLILHGLHRWLESWGLTILFLPVLVKAIGLLCVLLMPGKKVRAELAKERAELAAKRKAGVSSDYLAQELALQSRLSGLTWQLSIARILVRIEFLLRWYTYLGLYVILLFTTDLREARLGWIPDLTRPDPLYVLPLLVMLYWVWGVVLTQRHSPGRRQNRLLWLVPLGWAALNALLPAGGCLYHLASCLLTPVVTLVLSLPFIIWAQTKRLWQHLLER